MTKPGRNTLQAASALGRTARIALARRRSPSEDDRQAAPDRRACKTRSSVPTYISATPRENFSKLLKKSLTIALKRAPKYSNRRTAGQDRDRKSTRLNSSH